MYYIKNHDKEQGLKYISRAKWNKLMKTLNHAYNNSPFYRETWKKSGIKLENLADSSFFSKIPFTTKQDLRGSYPAGMLAVDWREVAILHESSGTTGEPTPSFFSESDLEGWFSHMLKNGINLTCDDIVLIKTPYSMLSTAHQMHGAARTVGATIIPASNRSQLMPYDRVIRLLSDYKPTVIYSLPIELLLFARRALKMGKNPRSDFNSIRGCVVNGEMLSEGKKLFLENLWNTSIYEDYGSTETTTLGGVCKYGILHAWEDRYYFEVEDEETGICSAVGTGELIVTSLDRKAMPMIRYRMGDIVTISNSKCGCQSKYKEIRIWGRKEDRIKFKNNTFFPIQIEDIIYKNLIGFMPVFWNASYENEQFDIFLECMDQEYKKLEMKRSKIAQDVLENIGIDVRINIMSEGSLMKLDNNKNETVHNKPKYICNKEQINQGLNYFEE